MDIFIAFRETAESGITNWNFSLDKSTGIANLIDSNGDPTGLSMTGVGDLWNAVSLSAGNVQGTGDASWVPAWANAQGRNVGDGIPMVISGLTPGETYSFEFYGLASAGTRVLSVSMEGGTAQELALLNNYTDTIKFTDQVATDTDFSFFLDDTAASDGSDYLCAMRISTTAEISSVELDQTTLSPGSTISGTYSGYQTVPTSPIVLTDKEGNTMSVAVNITDNGDGTGSFSGTMPSNPSSAPAQNLLYGPITGELN